MSDGCVLLCFQGFHLSGCGPARGVARHRHKAASRAAHLIWRCVHVRHAYIPLVSTQDGGESCSESTTDLTQGGIITMVTTVSKHTQALSLSLSLVCLVETLDIVWPCTRIVLRSNRSVSLK